MPPWNAKAPAFALAILARRPRPEPILRGFTHHRPLDVRNDAGQLLLEGRGARLAVSAHDRGPLVQFGEVVNQRGDDECVAVSTKLPLVNHEPAGFQLLV